MSLPSVGDIVFGDLLSDVRMKPKWEVYRGYFYALSAAVAFLMSDIITPTPAVDCLPRTGNSNATIKASEYITNQGNSWVKSHCTNQLPWWLAYIGLFAGFSTIVIFLFANWWLHDPTVASGFRTFAEVESIIRSALYMTKHELKSKVFRPDKVKDGDKLYKLKIALCLLWNIEKISAIETRYYIRNWILSFLCLVFSATTFIFVGYLRSHNDYFECSINEQTHVGILEEGQNVFVCTHGIAKKALPLLVMYGICLVLQLIAVVFGWMIIYLAVNRSDDSLKQTWGKYTRLVSYARFMKAFWEASSHFASDELWDFISFVCCQNALYNYVRPDKSGCLTSRNPDDKNYFDLLSQFGCGPFVYRTVTRLHKSPSFLSGYKILLKGFEYFRKENQRFVLSDIPDELIPEIISRRNYELLLDLLSILSVTENQEFGKIGGLLGLEFNQIDAYERSILHYAFESSEEEIPRFRAILHLLGNVEFEGKLFAHNQGKSSSVEQLIRDRAVGKQKAMLLDVVEKSERVICDRDAAERNILGQNVDSMDNFSRMLSGFLNQPLHAFSGIMTENVSRHLSRLQLSEWTITSKNIASHLHQQGLWNLLVELLNSFVQPDQTESEHIPMPLECGVKEFNLSAKPANSPPVGSVLFYALRKSTHRDKYYFTAIRHIINCSEGKENVIVWDEDGKEYPVIEFLKKQEREKTLEHEDIDKLYELFDIRNENGNSCVVANCETVNETAL